MDESESLRKQWATRLTSERTELQLELNSGGRGLVITLDSDGALSVRHFGGPLWSFGRVMNSERENLDVWRGVTPRDLHERFCQALLEAGYPVSAEHHLLVPDEHPSHVTARHTSGDVATMAVVHRFRQAVPALGRCDMELENLGYELARGNPHGSVANPELDLWTEQARNQDPPRPPPRPSDE